jgi:hypothetical protein
VRDGLRRQGIGNGFPALARQLDLVRAGEVEHEVGAAGLALDEGKGIAAGSAGRRAPHLNQTVCRAADRRALCGPSQDELRVVRRFTRPLVSLLCCLTKKKMIEGGRGTLIKRTGSVWRPANHSHSGFVER